MLLVLPALGLYGATFAATPAQADGQIFAVVSLTNETNTTLSIPFSGASTQSAWGTAGNTMQSYSGAYVVMPDGTPPRMLAPGQTMVWGTKSNGGFASTSGTGGSLSVPLPTGDQTASISWSVPWSYFNGGLPGSLWDGGVQGTASISSGSGFAAPNPFTIQGGANSCSPNGENTCLFSFALSGGPTGPAYVRGYLKAGQTMSMATACGFGGQCGSGTHALTSPDGSTTLSFTTDLPEVVSSGEWGGGLTLTDGPDSKLLTQPVGVASVQMQADGNLVGYDASGDAVWQTGTSGNPGAYLAITKGYAAVETSGGVYLSYAITANAPSYSPTSLSTSAGQPSGGGFPSCSLPNSPACGGQNSGHLTPDQPPPPPRIP